MRKLEGRLALGYTTRSDAREFVCPACGAESGEKCVGTRGRKRESVHRERMNTAARALRHPPIRTFTFDGSRLIGEDGSVIGQIVAGEIDVQSEELAGNLRRGDVDGAVVGEEHQDEKLSQRSAEESPTALFDVPDVEQEIHDFYCATVPGKANSKLTKEQRKLIRKALDERQVETIKQAIVGLAQSEHHAEGGWTALKYAIGKVKVSETVGDRIDMMARKAKPQTARDGSRTLDGLYAKFPSDARDIVQSWIEDVRSMLRNPANRGLKTTGEARLQRLRERGIELEIDGDRIAGWKEVNS